MPSVRTKFCANISFMFTENPFLERYKLAKEAGFKAVESGFPLGLSSKDVANAKNEANIEQILLNTVTGDVSKGELGFAAIPGKEQEFMQSLETTVAYADALNCHKIHIMSGKVFTPNQENDTVFLNNLKRAEPILRKHNIMGLIEPINQCSVPNYYLSSYHQAINIIESINSPHLRLMMDIFHLQHIQGNITHSIKEFSPYIGHVQIAQVPRRHEPDSPGELNFKYIFDLLHEIGYEDWIGLEYKPAKGTMNGLGWARDYLTPS